MMYRLCGNDFLGGFVVVSYPQAMGCPGVRLILSTQNIMGLMVSMVSMVLIFNSVLGICTMNKNI